MAEKLLMTWDILPGREQEYFEFVVRDFIPGVQRLGMEPSDAWYTMYGSQPQILAAMQMPNVRSLENILNSTECINRIRHGEMLTPGQTLYVLELEPAAYAALAANEAEKAAHINILEVRAFGSMGRVYLGGEERDIDVGWRAALAAIEGLEGREAKS